MKNSLTMADIGSLYLAHYGVKGMKWGVRKDRKRSNRPIESKIDSMSKQLNNYSATRGKASRERIKKSWQKFKEFCKKHKRIGKLLAVGGVAGLSIYIVGVTFGFALLRETSSTMLKDFAEIWR